MPARTPSSQALAELLPDLRRWALRLTNDPTAADDLLQETALRAHRFADSFQPGTSYRSWLFGIMRNQFINGYRKQRREREILDRVAFERPSVLEQPRANQDESVDDGTAAALAKLSKPHREILALLARGLAYREIADALECPIGTVMSRISRARSALLEHMNEGDIAA